MNISKTTINFALKRGLFIEQPDADGVIWVSVNDDCSEPMFSLLANTDGSASYRGNIWLRGDVKEELPAHYPTEKHVRAMLAFVAQEMTGELITG